MGEIQSYLDIPPNYFIAYLSMKHYFNTFVDK